MSRSLLLSLLAAAAAGAPLLFGIIRAMTTGNDFRYIWVALAAFISTTVVTSVVRVARGGARGAAALSALVFVVATIAAMLAARLLGTTINPGMLVVAASFGLCFAFAAGLFTLARTQAS
jgi:hypothetical protein